MIGMRRIGAAAALVAAAALLGTGCTPTGPMTANGTQAPDFTLETVDGRPVSLADTAGQVRLIDFWATWCAPCKDEIPWLNELQETYRDRGFQVLAISEEQADVIRAFSEKHPVVYTNLVGQESVSEAYGVLGLPSAYLLDGQGRIVESYVGSKPRRIVEEQIRSLLDGAGPT